MNKVEKPSNPNYNTPLSDSFRIYLMLAVSNGPNSVGAPFVLPDDGNWSILRNATFLELQTTDKIRKPSNPKYNTPSSEPFRIDSLAQSTAPPPPQSFVPVKFRPCPTCCYIFISFLSSVLHMALMMDVQNTSETSCQFLRNYTVQHSRRQSPSFSPSWDLT
jgi:hypothetical protein